jgi:hypothetical protein
MNVEKIEILGFDVRDLEEAIRKFSDILGTTFHVFDGEGQAMQSENASYANVRARAAIDRKGFIELVQSQPAVARDDVRNIHFKVPNLEEAVQEMKLKGYDPIDVVQIGGLKEAIFSPEDFCGIRLCFVEYAEPTLVEAMLAAK